MEIWRLEVLVDGVRVVEEIHATRDSAEDSLWDVVREAWDDDGIGRPFDTIPAKMVVKTFFDAMEEYSYSIKPFEIKSELPAKTPVNPWPDMEPVMVEASEIDILDYCLGNTQYGHIGKRLEKSLNAPVSPEFAARFVQRLRKKLVE